MTADKMTPPIPNSGTLSEIISVVSPNIVDVKFELHSEHPWPRLTVEFMRNVFWSCTFIWFNNEWHLQSFRMDANEYKKPEPRVIEITLDLLQRIEGGLNA